MSDPAGPRTFAATVAACGLPGTTLGPWSTEIPTELWPTYLRSLTDYRLTGLATAAWEAGWLALSDAQAKDVLAAQREAMLWALRLERELLILTDAFEGAGIDVIVLKGPALAHSVYPDPSWRCFGDLDLLVRTRDWRRALALLEARGFRRKLPEPRRGFDERFGKAATHERSDGVQIDLHRTLAAGPFGMWMRPEELFEHTASFRLGGRRLPRLNDTAIFLHACIHAALGNSPPLQLPLRDAAQVVSSGDVDWGELAELVRRWRLRAPVRYALETIAERLAAPLPFEAACFVTTKPPRAERLALASYTRAKRKPGKTELAALRSIPSIGAKAAYGISVLLPTREFLAARAKDGGSDSYIRRWAKPLLGARSSQASIDSYAKDPR